MFTKRKKKEQFMCHCLSCVQFWPPVTHTRDGNSYWGVSFFFLRSKILNFGVKFIRI